MRHSTWRVLALIALLLPAASFAAWRAEGPFAGNVNHLAFAPARPATVYAATSGGGVWRSADGGASWSLPGDEMTSRNVRWLAVDPVDAGVGLGRDRE